ncbi:MAG: 4'-phosphopantetheinyl transferase superfamily protein [Puniceicoccaceae bacterium]|nr:MAG: 4'-phosphopantetheinyl transferase superfamily protein [Puniceicoccaceae bacterium]
MKNDRTLLQIKSAAALILPMGGVFELSTIEVDQSFLSDAERALIETWAVPRQQEFAAGRLCARRGLAALGRPAVPLLRDADGLPLWPPGVVGSITHSRGIAAAALRPADGPDTLLGLDLEKTNRLSAAASRRVLHPREVGFAAGDQRRASVLFSLKEAFYKAQFPRWRTPGNFHDLALSVDLAAGRAVVVDLAPCFDPILAGLEFRFCLVDDYVLSLCWSEAA